jgi:hypothetical protein
METDEDFNPIYITDIFNIENKMMKSILSIKPIE